MKKKEREEKIKIPFHPIIIILFSLLFTFLVGGIIAGLNWTRLSKPQWKYPTIGASMLGFILYMLIYSYIPALLEPYIIYISYVIFAGVGLLLYLIQKPYYDMWKQGKI